MKKYKPQKQQIYLLLMILIAAFPMLIQFGYTRSPFYTYSDGLFHLKRFEYLYNAVSQGDFLNGFYEAPFLRDFGYPMGIFYPQAFLYPFVMLTLILRIDIINGYRLMLSLLFIFVALSTHFAIKKFKPNITPIQHLMADLGYLFIPWIAVIPELSYILKLVSHRVGVGELIAYIFMPWVFVGLKQWLYDDHDYKVLTLSLLGILYSHILTGYLMGFTVIIVTLYNHKKLKNKIVVKNGVKTLMWFLTMGAFQILPMLDYMSHQKYFMNSDRIGKPSLTVGTYLPFRIELPFWGQLLTLLIIVLLLIWGYKTNRKELSGMIFGSYLVSQWFPWILLDGISLLHVFQFPFRLTFIYSFFLVAFIIRYWESYKKLISFVVLSCTIFGISWTIITFQMAPDITAAITLDMLEDMIHIGGGAEYLPDNADIPMADGDNTWIHMNKLDEGLTALRETADASDHLIPRFYYKGIHLYLNGKEIPFKKAENGLIEIEPNPSKDQIEITYEETPIRLLSLSMSFIAGALFLYQIRHKKEKNHERSKL